MTRRAWRLLAGIPTIVAGALSLGLRADGATITAEYAEGYRDVLINGYGVRGLGTFRLRDGDATSVALCIEAHVQHSTGADAYAPVPNEIASDELDVLLWWVARHTPLDADTATAAAALAWYYTGAQRSGGGDVWADVTIGWGPLTPLEPYPWDGPLGPYSLAFPVGLRTGAVDLEAAEAKVAALHRGVQPLRGPWQIVWDGTAFVVTAGGRPLAGQPVQVVVLGPDGAELARATVATDDAGRAVPSAPDVPAGGVVRGAVDSPGVHREWDGADVQRLATPGVAWLTTEVTAPAVPTTSAPEATTTTTAASIPTTPAPEPTTSTSTTSTSTTSTSTTTSSSVPETTSTSTSTTSTPTTSVPETTSTATSTTSTTSTTSSLAPATSTTAPTVTVAQMAPPPSSPAPMLPVTGPSEIAAGVLHAADLTFVLGVLLLAASMVRRRPDLDRPVHGG